MFSIPDYILNLLLLYGDTIGILYGTYYREFQIKVKSYAVYLIEAKSAAADELSFAGT